ncbi:MAG: NAD(P)-dependent oxidoreductase [Chitinispirillales bacterium]|jgi:UDP-glucose 4-epimerase|nr:NAD(P)-dependent oxidoreductase [Chitinispirillales bacterium]
MKIFITGGTGNIGQYVTLAAINGGHQAVVLSRNPGKYPSLSKKAELVSGSITDYNLIAKCVQGCDAVIHIALGWGNEPVSMLTADTAATVNLLELSEKAGVKKFIYTSSTAAMGQMRQVMEESIANIPVDLYGSTKAASEAYVLGFRKYCEGREVSMKRNVIRPGYTYSTPPYPDGATQPDARFRDIANAVVNNRPVVLTRRDGTQFISAGEIAQLYLKLAESDKNEEVYLALGNAFTSWERIAQIAKEECPSSTSEIVLNDLGWGEEPMMFSVSRMDRDFGLSFDSQKDLREHIRWNVEQAINKNAR